LTEENKRILYENILEEIDDNLAFISSFKSQLKSYVDGDEVPTKEFAFGYLERSKDHVREKNLRKVINDSLRDLKMANGKLMFVTSYAFIPSGQKKVVEFQRKLKADNIQDIRNINERVKSRLSYIKVNLDRSITWR
jgi:hypothetical protein